MMPLFCLTSCSYNILKAWMQKDTDKPLRAEKHLIAGTVAGRENLVDSMQLAMCCSIKYPYHSPLPPPPPHTRTPTEPKGQVSAECIHV